MDEINITGIKIYAYHGVLDFEKEEGQEFLVDIKIFMSTERAGNTDNLDLTVDYGELSEYVSDVFSKSRFDLIEAASENLAQCILNKYELINEVWVTVNKPKAPIPVPFSNVSVTVKRKWSTAYISVGSNIGESKDIMELARKKIEGKPGFKDLRCASYIVTKPYGYVDQPDFLNTMWEVKTFHGPEYLLDILNEVEKEAGRERLIHWGPRTLDLDIVLYDDLIINTKRLTIPHADMENRLFVLEPLMELNPFAYNPRNHKLVKEMIDSLS